jgi:hypothetical protein
MKGYHHTGFCGETHFSLRDIQTGNITWAIKSNEYELHPNTTVASTWLERCRARTMSGETSLDRGQRTGQ